MPVIFWTYLIGLFTMSVPYVLTTTGFMLPYTRHYTPASAEEDKSVLERNILPEISNSSGLTVYRSQGANTAYKNYLIDSNFNTFMELVNIAHDVFSSDSLENIYTIQTRNKHMSPISFMFCVNLFNCNLKEVYLKYDSLDLNSKVLAIPSSTNTDSYVKLKKEYKQVQYCNADYMIASLVEDKNSFVSFFKYIFVDSFR